MKDRLRANLEGVRSRIEAACRRVGRNPSDVTLVAVTKTVPVPVIEALLELGHRDAAENRPVEGAARAAQVRGTARWHFVGHLQTNKARKVLERFEVLHSLDRDGLALELEKRLAVEGRRIAAFVQINVSGEGTKGGFPAGEAREAVARIRDRCPHLQVLGLMTMAPEGDPEAARPHFRRLRELAAEAGVSGLSMGMSGDFEAAVEEGATHVRIGTALFEGLLPQSGGRFVEYSN